MSAFVLDSILGFFMRVLTFFWVFTLFFSFSDVDLPLQVDEPTISAPVPGEALQGSVPITGTTDVPGFISAEVSFAYLDDPTETWFLIYSSNQAVIDGLITTWDTTGITDGNYTLRLQVTLSDGSSRETFVSPLRVRNYTAIETPTPLPTQPTATPLPTITPTPSPFPTPTPLSVNPAVLSSTELFSSILYGGSAAALIFIIIGIYLWLRWRLK
jgi:hypothetical protein